MKPKIKLKIENIIRDHTGEEVDLDQFTKSQIRKLLKSVKSSEVASELRVKLLEEVARISRIEDKVADRLEYELDNHGKDLGIKNLTTTMAILVDKRKQLLEFAELIEKETAPTELPRIRYKLKAVDDQ